MNAEILVQLVEIVKIVPTLVARFGKDGKQMEAFVGRYKGRELHE